MQDAKPVQRRTRPGTLTVPKKTGCPGCGTYTDGAGAWCATCSQKPTHQAPQGTRNLTPQTPPAYAEHGRFPGTPRT